MTAVIYPATLIRVNTISYTASELARRFGLELHGDGDTAVTWSADKIHDVIQAAMAAVKNELTDGAGAALDTLKELADALGNDPSFAATIAAEIANRVRYDAAQALSAPQQAQARDNIGAQAAAAVGDTDHDFVADYNTAKA